MLKKLSHPSNGWTKWKRRAINVARREKKIVEIGEREKEGWSDNEPARIFAEFIYLNVEGYKPQRDRSSTKRNDHSLQ